MSAVWYSLAKLSPIRLYYLAASTDQTGRLNLRLPDRVIGIHFRKACDDGVAQGLEVGKYVVRHLFVRDRDCDHDDD